MSANNTTEEAHAKSELRNGPTRKDVEKADDHEKEDDTGLRVSIKERLSHFTW